MNHIPAFLHTERHTTKTACEKHHNGPIIHCLPFLSLDYGHSNISAFGAFDADRDGGAVGGFGGQVEEN
jgi:hypothetical protein